MIQENNRTLRNSQKTKQIIPNMTHREVPRHLAEDLSSMNGSLQEKELLLQFTRETYYLQV